MAVYEFLVEPNTDRPDRPQGTIIDIKPEGIRIAPPAYAQWVASASNRPAALDNVPLYTRQAITRQVKRQRILAEENNDVRKFYARALGIPQGQVDMEEANAFVDGINYAASNIATDGWDSNFGHAELRRFGVVRFEADHRQVNGLLFPKMDYGPEGIAPGKQVEKRGVKIDLVANATAQRIARMQDELDYVAVAGRGTAAPALAYEEI